MLQLLLLQPKLAIRRDRLRPDVDALSVVSKGIQASIARSATVAHHYHNTRILERLEIGRTTLWLRVTWWQMVR